MHGQQQSPTKSQIKRSKLYSSNSSAIPVLPTSVSGTQVLHMLGLTGAYFALTGDVCFVSAGCILCFKVHTLHCLAVQLSGANG